MDFKRILRELRSDKGLSAKDLAQKLNFSVSIVYEWEHGRCEPSFEVLCKIANLFDVSVDYLIGNSEDFHSSTFTSAAVPQLSREEKELLKCFAGMNDVQKETLLELAKSLYNKNAAQLMKRA